MKRAVQVPRLFLGRDEKRQRNGENDSMLSLS